VLIGCAIVAIVAAVATGALFLRDMQRAYDRVQNRGSVLTLPWGDVEYTDTGDGPVVLVIHGSGGGYDQGELIGEAAVGNGFRVIAPSRFGYLRSSLPDGATWDDQANAYASLLDHLELDRVAVVAMSHGGPSALLFAVLHPGRVSSLTLISCGVVSVSTQGQSQADQKGSALTTIYSHDLLYWAATKMLRRQFMQLLGATADVIDDLGADQRQLLDRFIDYMNPVSPRSAGVRFDNRTGLPGGRIADIMAPTLIFHARDDTLQLFHNAEFAAATIPGARLLRFERGGHFLIGVEQARIRAALQAHVREHADRPEDTR
jgi:pimeloyl-ACP methyl ester carboxylesterase